MALADCARAGVWGSQPVIGIAGDYYTNPDLLALQNTAESHGDLLIDAPTSYVGDAYKFTAQPSFRISNSQGYSSLDSDYAHLNLINEFDGPLDTLIVTAGASQDSSLYHDYLLNGSSGVKRDGILGDVNWDRLLSERMEFDVDGNWTRLQYAHASGVGTLIDYKYAALSPTLVWAQSERGKLTLSATVGRYDSLDGLTRSVSASAQAGFAEKMSETWSITATSGYSRANNSANIEVPQYVLTPSGIYIVFVPERIESHQNGSVYSVSAKHQSERWTLDATVSRQLAPTGFAFLAQQQTYELKDTWNATERWVLSGDLRRVTYRQPAVNGTSAVEVSINNISLAATWQWTEHWTASFQVTRIMERINSPSLGVDSSGVSMEIARHFDWKSIQ
jgi:hypothetical protein